MTATATKPPTPATRVGRIVPGYLDDPRRGFKNHVEFLEAIIAEPRGRMGPAIDERLRVLATAGSDEASTASAPYGGFLVPRGFYPEPLAPTALDPVGQRVTRIRMTEPRTEIPARTAKDYCATPSAGMRVTRRAETTQLEATRVKIEQIVLTAKSLFAFTYCSNLLMRASPEAFSLLLSRAAGDAMTGKLLHERLHGTGAGTYEGVSNAACTIPVERSLEGAILAADVQGMRVRIWNPATAVWVANNDCYKRLSECMVSTDVGSESLYHHSEREGEPDTLCGCAIFYTPAASALGNRGDLVLGNWSEYVEGEYQPLAVAESLDARFDLDERAFRFSVRSDGCPWWREPLTPENGAATLSAFVTLV
jgi:HK97 family phage major capsid protein